MVDMLTLMDTLQALGVDTVQANRFAAALVRSKPTLLELYGRGKIKDAANGSHRDLNIIGQDALDLRTCKPDGSPWDFTRKADRLEALRLVRERRPTWVIGSPPCTAFSTLMCMNFNNMDPEKAKRLLATARMHLHFTASLYYGQLLRGDTFLHEHPNLQHHGASPSWSPS